MFTERHLETVNKIKQILFPYQKGTLRRSIQMTNVFCTNPCNEARTKNKGDDMYIILFMRRLNFLTKYVTTLVRNISE